MPGFIARLIPILLVLGGTSLLGFGTYRAIQAFRREPGKGKWILMVYLGVALLIIAIAIFNRS